MRGSGSGQRPTTLQPGLYRVRGGGGGGGGGGEGGNGNGNGNGGNGNGNGGDGGGGGGGDHWPPHGWEDPPGIFPPLTPTNPFHRLEEGPEAPPPGAVWPKLPVNRGKYAVLVEHAAHGPHVVVVDASVQWPEHEEHPSPPQARPPGTPPR